METRDDFPLTEETVYLDSAATTLTPKPVADEMAQFMVENGGNYGRGSHSLARTVTHRVEDVRENLQDFLGTEDPLVFTRGTTESINAVSKGLDLGRVVTTDLEHHSNLMPWMREADEIDVVRHEEGYLPVEEFQEKVDGDTDLVAVTHVSNVFGTRQPVEEVAEIAHENDALLLVDGAQSAGHVPFDVDDLGCDLFAFSGHKGPLGPQGIGGLTLTEEVAEEMDPLLLGGGAVHYVTLDGYELEEVPARFEAGTPNIPGIVGLGRSIEYLQEFGRKRAHRRSGRLSDEAAERLSEIDGVELLPREEGGEVVPFNLEGWNPHDVASILDRLNDVCLRSGHHCAIPCLERLSGRGAIRASFALYNDEEDVEALVDGVKKVLKMG